jgi:hypothetical protein
MTIIGTYIVKSNDEIIGEFKNMLTTNGLYVINQFLSGQTKYWADTLAIGALSSSATTASTTSLQYEAYRYPVIFKSYQTTASNTNQLILKATIDPVVEFQAYEIGVFPARVDLSSFSDHYQITAFSESTNGSSQWYIGANPATITSSATVTARIGSSLITLPVGSTASITNLSLNSTRYTENDYIGLLYYTISSIPTASITVTLGDSSVPQLTWSGSITTASSTASAYLSANIDMNVKNSSFVEPITTASVTFAGASGSVALDHMKFFLGTTQVSDLQLASRSISSSSTTPLFSKVYSQPMDIEYYIQVT